MKWFTDDEIPEKILAQLRLKGQDVAYLVRRSGLSRATLDRLLNREHAPRYTTIAAVADAFEWAKSLSDGKVGVPDDHPLANLGDNDQDDAGRQILAQLSEASRGTGKPLDRFVDYLLGLHEKENKKALAADALRAGKRRSA